MSIAIKKTTTVVLFAFLLAGLFVLLSQLAFGGHQLPPGEPFHIMSGGASTGCATDPERTVKCCVNWENVSCDYEETDWQACKNWAETYCEQGQVSKVQDFVGNYCVASCPPS